MKELTKQTAEAFVVSIRANIQAAQLLLTEHNFNYVLPGVFADEALEKFFGVYTQYFYSLRGNSETTHILNIENRRAQTVPTCWPVTL